jgi:ROK family
MPGHGAAQLPSVVIDTYNEEMRDADGFVGDRASRRAFYAMLDDWRAKLAKVGDDPLGEKASEELGKKRLDKLLIEGNPETAALLHGAVEDFAQELATVARRFLRLKTWRGTQRIVVGGGLRDSRLGELAIGRASLLLKAEGTETSLQPVRHHPDQAGLIGAVHLAPAWVFSGHDAILAVDIGGTNMRAGVVKLNLKQAADLAEAEVVASEIWRHRDDKPTRDQALERLGKMLRGIAKRAEKAKLRLAPFIGVGCPGLIEADGSIRRGGQNLPGNWESSRFNLPASLRELVPELGGHETTVVLHNDAVVQGLSERPFMADVEHWGVLTIGTGLGNARFTNRKQGKGE